MILPVVNVLVHAFRSDSSDHDLCRRWLNNAVNGDARYGMSPQVLSGVIRVTTPRVFSRPSALAEVIGFCELLIAQPHCAVIHPGPQHWSIFARLCKDADARSEEKSSGRPKIP